MSNPLEPFVLETLQRVLTKSEALRIKLQSKDEEFPYVDFGNHDVKKEITDRLDTAKECCPECGRSK